MKDFEMFQFLIGTVQLVAANKELYYSYNVSIPHRYSTTTVFMRLTRYVISKHSI